MKRWIRIVGIQCMLASLSTLAWATTASDELDALDREELKHRISQAQQCQAQGDHTCAASKLRSAETLTVDSSGRDELRAAWIALEKSKIARAQDGAVQRYQSEQQTLDRNTENTRRETAELGRANRRANAEIAASVAEAKRNNAPPTVSEMLRAERQKQEAAFTSRLPNSRDNKQSGDMPAIERTRSASAASESSERNYKVPVLTRSRDPNEVTPEQAADQRRRAARNREIDEQQRNAAAATERENRQAVADRAAELAAFCKTPASRGSCSCPSSGGPKGNACSK